MDLSDKLFEFEGRLRRRDWWLLSIGLGLFQWIITQVVAPMVLGADGRPQMNGMMPSYPLPLLVLILAMSAIMLWPQLALAAKRDHDRDKSANLSIILIVISTLGSWAVLLGSGSTPDILLMGLFGLFSMVAGLYLLVTLGFLDGTPGPNEYGASPKGYAGYSIDLADEFA